MSNWHDVFGTEIQEGDYILSGAKTGSLKVGEAYYSKTGMLMMRVKRFFSYGSESPFQAKYGKESSAVGVNVVVLKTKDGVIPGPVQNIW